MNSFAKKFIKKIILFIRYNPYDYSRVIRAYFYRFIFKRSGKLFNILDGVVINSPENISIGNRVSIHQFCYFDAQEEIIIGDNVSIGSDVKLITSSHKFDNNKILIKDQGISKKPIFIGDNVWIGSGVIVLQGVKIGKNSIIGANSLVNKDLPENTISGGVPCKVIKQRIL